MEATKETTKVIAGPAGHWYALEDGELIGTPIDADGGKFDRVHPPQHPSQMTKSESAKSGWYAITDPAPETDDKAIIAELKTVQPTVMLVIGGSFITKDEGGEIIETVDVTPFGTPDWECGGICDPRGGGGREGYQALVDSLEYAERNAKFVGLDIVQIER